MQPQNQTPENNLQPNEAPQPSATPPPPTFGDDRARPPATPPGTTEPGVVAPDSVPSQPADDSPQTYPNPAPVTPSGGLQPPASGGPIPLDSRVSTRVPMVRIYAWAVIGYALISFVISLIGMVGTIRADIGLAIFVLGPWLLMGVLAGPGLQVLIGIYLLFAKSLRNVSIVLVILLVLGIFGLLAALTALLANASEVTPQGIVTFVISIFLVVLLWRAQTKVEAERKLLQL